MTASEHFSDQRSRIATELRRVAGKADHPYALLDFPNHGNPGDAAIWVGERRMLRKIYGCRPVYTASIDCFSLENLRRRLGGEGTVFLHGGGNFGDLWGRHELFRERVIRSMPEQRIVMLPQTIHFEERSALDRARSVIDDHPSITILLRDRDSFETARREFVCAVALCPDGAVEIGRIQRPEPPSVDFLFLLRRDQEKKFDVPVPSNSGSRFVIDWIEPIGSLVEWSDQTVRRVRAVGCTGDRLLHEVSGMLGDGAARARLKRAIETLSRGRVLITDRLHGHILSTLMGIPNVVLDNSYGKNRRYYETWNRNDRLSRFCEDPSEAVQLACQFLELVETDGSLERR